MAIFLVDVASGVRKQITFPGNSGEGDILVMPSPDGSMVAFVREEKVTDIWLTAVAGGPPRRLTRLTRWRDGVLGLDWMPGGRELVFSLVRNGMARLYTISVDGSEKDPLPLEGVDLEAGYPIVERGVSPHSERIAFETWAEDRNIWRWDRTGRRASERPLVQSLSVEDCPSFSPSGNWIAYRSNRSGLSQLWVADLDGTAPLQLTHMTEPAGYNPSWSPDGNWIAFDAGPATHHDVYVVAAGGGEPQWIARGANARWSRDSRWVYFNLEAIWKKPLEGGNPVLVVPPPVYEMEESMDGQRLYYTKSWDRLGLWTRPVAGGAETQVSAEVRSSSWAIGRSGLFYIRFNRSSSPVIFQDLSTGGITRLGEIHGNVGCPRATISPDENSIVYCKSDSELADLMMVDGVDGRRRRFWGLR